MDFESGVKLTEQNRLQKGHMDHHMLLHWEEKSCGTDYRVHSSVDGGVNSWMGCHCFLRLIFQLGRTLGSRSTTESIPLHSNYKKVVLNFPGSIYIQVPRVWWRIEQHSNPYKLFFMPPTNDQGVSQCLSACFYNAY